MSYKQFQTLLQNVRASTSFQRWGRQEASDAFGRRSSPIELLLLGALRYLGRGLTFDDLEEYTAINEETHRQFLLIFIKWGASDFYDAYVRMPSTAEEFRTHQAEFSVAGLPGAEFSCDATNVIMWQCYHKTGTHWIQTK